MDGEKHEEPDALRKAVLLPEKLQHRESRVDGSIADGPEIARRGALRRKEEPGGLGIPEERVDRAVPQEVGHDSGVQRDAVAKHAVPLRVLGGDHDGVCDPLREEVEKRLVKARPQGGEAVVELRGHEVPGPVVRVCGGEDQSVRSDRHAARCGPFGHLRAEAGGDREELRGDERRGPALAVSEEEGAGMETRPMPTGHPSRDGVASHGQAGWRREVGFPDARDETFAR